MKSPWRYIKEKIAARDALLRARAICLISSVPEGRALLDLARDKGCPIRMNGMVVVGGEIATMFDRRDKTVSWDIRLSRWRSGGQVAMALGHELRHLWQFTRMENVYVPKFLPVTLDAAFRRGIEGDARRFEKFMSDRIFAATGTRIPFRRPLRLPWRRKEAGKDVFWAFQDSFDLLAYDVAVIKARLQMPPPRPVRRGQYAAIFNAMAQDLRRITRDGLDADSTDYMAGMDGKEMLTRVISRLPSLLRRGRPG